MIEDDIYRTSSQFRVWSYTEKSLQSLRATTNVIASDRVRAALRRAREAQQSATPSATGTPQPGSDVEGKASDDKAIDCLTPEEELVFVRYYCESLLELGDEYKPPLPTTVRVSFVSHYARQKQYLTTCSLNRPLQSSTFAGSI